MRDSPNSILCGIRDATDGVLHLINRPVLRIFLVSSSGTRKVSEKHYR